jgi:TonB family protein
MDAGRMRMILKKESFGDLWVGRLAACARVAFVGLGVALVVTGGLQARGQEVAKPDDGVLADAGGNDFPGVSGPGQRLGLEVLSDTRGVDFGPYFRQMMQIDSTAWRGVLAQNAGLTGDAEGTTVIRMTVGSDGAVTAMRLDARSGNAGLDRAAWSSLAGVGRFPAMPKEFRGTGLELRVRFSVSPEDKK